jgi:hypothetical protein
MSGLFSGAKKLLPENAMMPIPKKTVEEKDIVEITTDQIVAECMQVIKDNLPASLMQTNIDASLLSYRIVSTEKEIIYERMAIILNNSMINQLNGIGEEINSNRREELFQEILYPESSSMTMTMQYGGGPPTAPDIPDTVHSLLNISFREFERSVNSKQIIDHLLEVCQNLLAALPLITFKEYAVRLVEEQYKLMYRTLLESIDEETKTELKKHIPKKIAGMPPGENPSTDDKSESTDDNSESMQYGGGPEEGSSLIDNPVNMVEAGTRIVHEFTQYISENTKVETLKNVILSNISVVLSLATSDKLAKPIIDAFEFFEQVIRWRNPKFLVHVLNVVN